MSFVLGYGCEFGDCENGDASNNFHARVNYWYPRSETMIYTHEVSEMNKAKLISSLDF
jgi:hypothetical protein